MDISHPYFFCGIGGSGMLPLSLILRGSGASVAGSDRALDQGRTAAKFEYLKANGIALYPQDGSGVSSADQIVVISAAVEETVPDVVAARKVGAPLLTRAELLAQLFNAAPTSIGVAGTSGKSTVTGMIGWMLTDLGRDPTIMNGAVMKNFVSADAPFASARVGKSGVFVSEVDESDGSIARYSPHIAVVNNIALDHKTMDELRALFAAFVAKAKVAVLNLDNPETAALVSDKSITYSLSDSRADLLACDLTPAQDGISFQVISRGDAEKSEQPPPRGKVDGASKASDIGWGASDVQASPPPGSPASSAGSPTSPRGGGESVIVNLKVPGAHNVSNALAALAAAKALDIPLEDAARALERFEGIRRRLEVVATANGITIIDDFAHNPDKIAATLATLHAFPGRLLLMFQPHGFSPLRKMQTEFIDVFARDLGPDDLLLMPEPVYYGGTTDKSVSSEDIAAGIRTAGRHAIALPTRADCGDKLLELARSGDRIVIMGARDDTLAIFANDLLSTIQSRGEGG
jgi:UDP-N-acetylmuramate--alanine ligase